MDNLLYIGLHGYAGSGKDTVAKALRLMLSYNWSSFDEFKAKWKEEAFKLSYATFGQELLVEDENTLCIAFADQLKHICSEMFGIPVEHFYYNKENGWIDITGTFKYVEKLPYEAQVITADDYNCMKNSNIEPSSPLWMSLREVLVYVGTYICQPFINKLTFTNGVQNKIKMVAARNKRLKYVICTDVRFYHEVEFIKNHHGINIDIIRSGVKQLDNIAEHDLDDEDIFDLTINNDSTYDDLLNNLWNEVHENVIFKNNTIILTSYDTNTVNYLRQVGDNTWQACFQDGLARIGRENGSIKYIDPSGGPMICTGTVLTDMYGTTHGEVMSIELNDSNTGYYIVINPYMK